MQNKIMIIMIESVNHWPLMLSAKRINKEMTYNPTSI